MKKLRSVFCITVLSTILVANVFAGNTVSTSVYGFFDNVITAVVSFLRDDCPPRQCQNCRPTEVSDDHGNCRPRED